GRVWGGRRQRAAAGGTGAAATVASYCRPVPPLMYSRARSSIGSLPDSRSSTVGTTSTSGFTPRPAYSVPSAYEWRVTENWTPQFLGSANVAMSPTLPADGSPMMTPRPVVRNAARRSSAAPEVALDATNAIGPP